MPKQRGRLAKNAGGETPLSWLLRKREDWICESVSYYYSSRFLYQVPFLASD